MVSNLVSLSYCVRKLRGSSQPILATADDGCFYVVKMQSDLQGSNTLFNEAAGTELYRALGLPTADWRPVYVSSEFLRLNSACRYETADGSVEFKPGIAFGSRVVFGLNCTAIDIIPSSRFPHLLQSERFWLAWLVDVCAFHTDNRQAVFTRMLDGRLDFSFIDHGRMFGGIDGQERPRTAASSYMDPRIYPAMSEQLFQTIVQRSNKFRTDALAAKVRSFPMEWITDSASQMFADALDRLSQRQAWDVTLRAISRSLALSECGRNTTSAFDGAASSTEVVCSETPEPGPEHDEPRIVASRGNTTATQFETCCAH